MDWIDHLNICGGVSSHFWVMSWMKEGVSLPWVEEVVAVVVDGTVPNVDYRC